jgi:hypothetical protein
MLRKGVESFVFVFAGAAFISLGLMVLPIGLCQNFVSSARNSIRNFHSSGAGTPNLRAPRESVRHASRIRKTY